MERTYLHVPPEDSDEARTLGAHWDAQAGSWYIDADQVAGPFARWRSDDEEDRQGYAIRSDDACVAAATVPCPRCRRSFEVICIHCRTGSVLGEPLEDFTVSDISEVDAALADQLKMWPTFRPMEEPAGERGDFANHCPHCGATYPDQQLHEEPDDPFFDVTRATQDRIRFTRLVGAIALSGDEHYRID